MIKEVKTYYLQEEDLVKLFKGKTLEREDPEGFLVHLTAVLI